MRLLSILLALQLQAQDLPSIHLSKQHAEALRAIWERKVQAEREWKQAQRWIYSHYVAQPGTANAGDVELNVESLPAPWQWGIQFTTDFEVLTPKPEPKPQACPVPLQPENSYESNPSM